MTKREWLISKGLAKNSRGKFSKEAKAALEEAEKSGVVFTEKEVVEKPETEQEPPVRNLGEELICYTRGGYEFVFSNCRACGKHINWCKCPTIIAPAIAESLPKNSPAIIVRKNVV